MERQNEFDAWINQGLAAAGIHGVTRLDDSAASNFFKAAADRYTTNKAPSRWWETLRRPLWMFDLLDVQVGELLTDLIGTCILVPETGELRKPAYILSISDVPRLLEACSVGFEYYLLGPDLEWIIIESDHNQLYAMGTLVAFLSSKESLVRRGQLYL
jgi:hypothetical protein